MSETWEENGLPCPNQESDRAKWRVVGASVIGTSHLKVGKPCQDAFSYKCLPSGEMVIAVADGAGSSAHAEEGSRLAVQAAITSAEEQFELERPINEDEWQAMVQTIFREACTPLVQKASTSEASRRDYATTLMVVILTEAWTIAGLIGDCAAVVLQEADEFESLCQPQTGEYANTTNFLTQHDAARRVDVQIRAKPVLGVAVFSDGLSRLALNIAQNKPHPPFFKPLFAFVTTIKNEQEAKTQLEAFLNSERVNARTDDDKTLVIACRMVNQESQDASAQPSKNVISA